MSKGYTPPSRWAETLRRILYFHWHMQTTYCPEWDHYVRMALTLGMVSFGDRVSEHVCSVGPHEVWVSNYPYAYGHSLWADRFHGLEPDLRPSYATMRLLHKEVARLRREKEENTNAKYR